MTETPGDTPPKQASPNPAVPSQTTSRRSGTVRSAWKRSWLLVRGEHEGPVSRLLGRPVTLRVGRRRRYTTVGALSAVLLVLALLLGSVVVFATPLLGARSVQVVGVKTLTADEVVSAANIDDGTPLARLNTAEIESRVRTLPQVARAAVVRAWPATVRIKVTERRPAAVVARGAEFVVVDTLGVPYQVMKERPAKLPLIKLFPGNDVTIPDFTDDKKTNRNKTLVAAVQAARVLTPELLAKTVHVTAIDPRRVSVQLVGGREIFWGAADDPSDNVRKAAVATALLSRSGRTIDVSTPGVVSVR